MSLTAPSNRNLACPCGSGLRYKHCHGRIAAPAAADPMEQVRKCLASGDRVGAVRACEEVLAATPEHAGALQVLAQCAYDGGKPLEGLRLALSAARAVPKTPLSPVAAFNVWTTLNFMFTQALAGVGTDSANIMRDAYERRLDQGGEEHANAPEDVTVVLAIPGGPTDESCFTTLDALAAQTLPPRELVVVSVGSARIGPAMRARLARLPFPAPVLDQPATDFAAALDAGIAAGKGYWLLAIEPPHSLAPNHLQSLVTGLRAHCAQWGFSACTWEPAGRAPPESIADRAAAGAVLQQSIAEADTVGFSLIHQEFVAVGEGAVLFSRSLFNDVGGFRNLPGHVMWDFAMRALWLAEPWYTAEPTYRHRISAGSPVLDAATRGAVQIRLFRDYYALACDETRVPPNPFAPSLARWGLHCLKRVYQTGHVLAFDLTATEALAARIFAVAEARKRTVLTPGVNLVGFAYGEFGLGESLRALARAAEAGKIPFIVKDVDQRLQARQADRSVAGHVSEDLRHQLSLFCLNPDMLKPILPLLQATRDGGGRNIAYWYWELDRVPREWDAAFDGVDEIWCATEFIATAMRGATDKPVFKIPPPIELQLGRRFSRADFALPEAPFLFLFTFDFNSFVMRKNPEAVIRAFRSAFPAGRDDVGLVVKSINGAHRPELVEAIRALIGGDQRIIRMDAFLSRDQTYGLIGACDAYVSLHRSEGLGLGLAEAMYLGKPVVGTAYSGNLEFMNEGNSALVDYRMVPVKAGEYLYNDPRFTWAEADVDDAARHLRRLVDDPEWRRRLAETGQRDIRTRFTRERTAAGMRARMIELGVLPPPGPLSVPAFVSWAQNGEDALLARVLKGVERGRYIDVGANDPDSDSVTRALYERGWSGINIEPVHALRARLDAARPWDINLSLAAGRSDGAIILGEIADTGLSTAQPDVAARHEKSGYEVTRREVPMLTLDTIWRRHVDGDVHFLKIDVEGNEGDVLAGIDLDARRPWIIVVEATVPLTRIPSHQTWEPRILAAGYLFAHDDGLNRYYVAQEHAALVAEFAAAAEEPVTRAVELVAHEEGLAPEKRFDPGGRPHLDLDATEPTLARPGSQLCTAGQFRESVYARWCHALWEIPSLHTKQWESVYALQVLDRAGLLQPGRRGLGFGCGRGPLAAVMANRGCQVVATSLEAAAADGHGGVETEQHAAPIEDLSSRGICPEDRFGRQVRFVPVDMNDIPEDFAGFDFVWSSSAFGRLGSLEHGLAFVRRAMRCLRPGGFAVHTTEFNLTSNVRTIEAHDLSVFRRQDLERLSGQLEADGHRMRPINFNPGNGPVDRYVPVELPPQASAPRLKLKLGRFVCTSIGLVIQRGD